MGAPGPRRPEAARRKRPVSRAKASGRGRKRISDSDAEGPAGPREERRAAARPEQSLRRVAVRVDPALLGDAGVLLEALRALGCERHVEAQRPARSLRWSRAQPDPRPRAVSVLARAPRAPPRPRALRVPRALRAPGAPPCPPVPPCPPRLPVPSAPPCPPALPARCAPRRAASQGEEGQSPGCHPRTAGGTLGCTAGLVGPQRPRGTCGGAWAAAPPPSPRVSSEVQATDQVEVLLLLEPEEFLRGIKEFLQGIKPLTQTCRPAYSMPWACPESSTGLHLAVIGLDAYLQSHQPSSREVRQPEGPAVACAPVALSWPKVEEALVLLQLWAHLDVLLVPSWQELSQHVCTFTKAFAQHPFKQYRESCAFSFCMDGRWAAGEQVARDGTGLRGVWWRQIKQFNRVSPAVADAVVAAFPSPCLLQQAYMACSTEQERLALLADLPVKVGECVAPQRVGPDLSRRIYLFLISTDPEFLLDLGS
ncbi:LOW QUALITY PROTEIN: probable crossover junction endonuclease EME2 isoform X4 [Canis lupus familiaris]|uniref:LOW QUALITY PROTEIN: probable crossover junction endonuclease EME2 isoform X4 n=1 Tax=Canis lupus familiaris TaxID=9615 RepID=UPI0018F5ABAF|nr:LOW QUALITY PROTEIN: probable crossover junction endonuclease EME2 isoform X4 [Canis lupus familiaris]